MHVVIVHVADGPVLIVFPGVWTDIVIRWMELQMSSCVGADVPCAHCAVFSGATTLVRPHLFK